jgi:signal transduction histidine kinase
VRLVEFIHDNHVGIIEEWEAFALTQLPGMTSLASRDHAEEILSAIECDMCSAQSGPEQIEKSRGHGKEQCLEDAGHVHAKTRLEGGFRLGQMVAEYRALRASVLRLWGERGDASDLDGVTRFNEAIDEALTAATNRYMETMEHYRDQFLAILGHDLRNPIGAIALGASTLARATDQGEASARVASCILSSARRMDRLVADLLDLTRTRLGPGIPLHRAPMDLAPVCRQVVAEIKQAHPREPVRFAWRGDLHGEWDGDRLAQVLQNLVGNAIQYGAKEAPVTVTARGGGDEVVLEIHNEGPPIPSDVVGTIFEPMTHHGAESGGRQTNLGLGLYIAEQVVSAHGGKIGVTSSEAEGTTFVVHLPRMGP